MLEASEGGSVDLFHNGSKKLETISTGISVTGGGAFTGGITTTSGDGVNAPLGVFSTAALDTNVLRFIKTGSISYNWTFPSTTSVRFGPDTGTDKLFQIKNSGSGVFNVEIDGDLTVDGAIIHGGDRDWETN